MKKIFYKTIRILAYAAATIIILLAISIELFRLFLPRVPEYQDDIKAEVSAAIGLQIEFSDMDARWGISGPELAFYDTEFIHHDEENKHTNQLLRAEEVRIGISLIKLIFEQVFIVDRLVITKTTIDVQQSESSDYQIKNSLLKEFLESKSKDLKMSQNMEIIGEKIELRVKKFNVENIYFFEVLNSQIKFDKKNIIFDSIIILPDYLGQQLTISASKLYLGDEDNNNWDVFLDADGIILSDWSNLLEIQYQFQSGIGDMEVALAISDEKISSLSSDLNFNDVSLMEEDKFNFSGRIEADFNDNDWLVAINDLQLSINEKSWPKTSFQFQSALDEIGNTLTLNVEASYLNLDDFKIFKPWLDKDLSNLFFELKPSGEIKNFIASVSEINSVKPQFNLSAELEKVGFIGLSNEFDIKDFSGLVRANHAGGLLEINSNQLSLNFPEYFPTEIFLDKADGTIIWRNSKNQTTIISNSIAINNDVINSDSNIQLILYKNGLAPVIDLESDWNILDIAQAKQYIPRKILNPNLFNWIQMALVSGSISQGTTILNGTLDKFPFDDGQGQLSMRASVRDMNFKYHKLWPAVENLDVELILDNNQLYTIRNQSMSAGIPITNAKVSIPNLRNPVLNVESFFEGSIEPIHKFSMQTPISGFFDDQLENIKVGGDVSLGFNLKMPLRKKSFDDFEFQLQMNNSNGSLKFANFGPSITNLKGQVLVNRNQIKSTELKGLFLGEEINISIKRSKDPGYGVIATFNGIVDEDGLINELGLPLESIAKGAIKYESEISFPSGNTDVKLPLSLRVNSDLNGLELNLPAPFGKSIDSSLSMSNDIFFNLGEELIESVGFVENNFAWQLNFNKVEESWNFDRGVIMLGETQLQSADTKGLHIRGLTNEIRFKDWLNFSSKNKKENLLSKIRSIDLTIGDLYLLGQYLEDHRVRVDRSALEWLIQVNGNDVIGSVFVPYDFNSGREMVFNMEKFRLPGDESENKKISDLDPRKLPAMRLSATEFALGDRYFGSVEAVIEKTEKGLVATNFSSSDASFTINGKGGWLANETDPLGSHSYFVANLISNDVDQTMDRLNYTPGIDGNQMLIDFDMNWSGNPRPDFLDMSNGEVKIQFGNGQLKEVEPGAGRVFGLMSILALPRRLSLDFRDVFSKGFGFDKITGTFKIEKGITFTCDLSLEGPAADIGIVGKSDITKRTYDQAAIVYPNVGNTLPIVGAVVAGPQAIPALLIFSQIFKKPLQGVGQAYYSIEGSWDEPDVESTDSLEFVNSSETVCQMLAEG
tara:strand:- start:1461 stop:5303 length:3843 start_codon:yes stop_codon:yes gene_type:complete